MLWIMLSKMEIRISESILKKLPNFDIIALSMDVTYQENNDMVLSLINQYEQKIKEEYSLEDVLNIPLIKEARDSYKKLGKDPSRYRLACESLLRRLVKGNNLYIINNLVDIGNILSIDCKRSVAVLDYDKIEGDVLIRLGRDTDIYEGIGRGLINIENIPLYEDNVGPFGSTTSDTLRTSITKDTKKILLFVVCFGDSNKERDLNKAIELYQKYCNASNIQKIEIMK